MQPLLESYFECSLKRSEMSSTIKKNVLNEHPEKKCSIDE